MTTWNEFAANPDAQRVVVMHVLPLRRPGPWTADGSRYWCDWPADAPETVEELDLTAGTTATLTAASDLADCAATETSWFFDASTARLHVNPTGTAVPDTDVEILTRRTERIDTRGSIFSNRFHRPAIVAMPALRHHIAPFASAVTRTLGRLTLSAEPDVFDAPNRLLDECWLQAPVQLYLGGTNLPFNEYRQLIEGYVRQVEWDEERGQTAIRIDDAQRLLERTVDPPAGGQTTYAGRIDQIYTAILTGFGFSTAGIPDLSTSRPWTLRVTIGERMRIRDILQLLDESAFCWHRVDRSGNLVLHPWEPPDESEPDIAVFDEDLETGGVTVTPSLDHLVTAIQLTFGAGARAAPTRHKTDDRSQSRHRATLPTTGWTNHPIASNTFYRALDAEPDEVWWEYSGAKLRVERERDLNGCNTNNLSWFYHDNERRLYINPPGVPPGSDPTALTSIWYYWRRQNSRTSPSGAGLGDENVAEAVDAVAAARWGLTRERRLSTVIDNATHAADAAETMLGLLSRPMLLATFESVLRPLDREVGDTIRLDLRNAVLRDASPYFRIYSIEEDYVKNRVRVAAWRPYDFSDN